MRVVITGGTGFIGRPLVEHLAGLGYECTVLTRDVRRAQLCGLLASVQFSTPDVLPAADAVIHLAGESIASFWTATKKRAIFASRVEGTRRLIELLRRAKIRPHTLLSASAVGFYGHRPGEVVDEASPGDPAASFRAEVCRLWEREASVADQLGIRVVNLRIGNVMDRNGGFLGAMEPLHRMVGGVVLGDSAALLPWISRTDCVRMIAFALANERWYGPVNVTHPEPLTRTEFATSLAAQFQRTRLVRIPEAILRSLCGDFASALADDQNVVPTKAAAAGFRYVHQTWGDFLAESFRTPEPEEMLRPAANADSSSPGTPVSV